MPHAHHQRARSSTWLARSIAAGADTTAAPASPSIVLCRGKVAIW